MVEDTKASKAAYAAAVREIARVIKAGETQLKLDDKKFNALTRIPPNLHDIKGLYRVDLDNTQINDLTPLQVLTGLQQLLLNQTGVVDLTPLQALTGLQGLYLNQTGVVDLTPLQALTGLQTLSLDQTGVVDLTPLQALTGLQVLYLNQTGVVDLRPICDLPLSGKGPFSGIRFANTPAIARDPELLRLSAVEDNEQRTRETLAYLKTLPKWPEPLPWLVPQDPPPLTLTALLDAQERAGWRYSPSHGALQLYVQDLPESSTQTQMAVMVKTRATALLDKLGGRVNSGGLRQEVHEETTRFVAILADDTRSLSLRALEMWGSLVALGNLLEANDTGTKAGRDKLDLLPPEPRAALITCIGVAAGLVRSFPEARALDDDYGAFNRRIVTREMVLDLLEQALRAKFVDEKSGALMQHVAAIGQSEGKQADKASSVTIAGLRNLILTATLISSSVGAVVGGVFSGIASDVGTDISNHYALSEKAIDFLDGTEGKISDFLDALTPDERARLQSALDDAISARAATKPNEK